MGGKLKANKLMYMGILAILAIFMMNHSTIVKSDSFNVTTKVNVTNAYPEILQVKLAQNIIPNAGTTKTVDCNITARDWNGYTNIVNVNATFWDNNSAVFGDPDNNLTHYTNSSCRNTSQNGYYVNFTCSFSIYYYVNNGTWVCNATIIDQSNFTANNKNSTTILSYYALNATPILDFGDMVLSNTSTNITINMSNIANSNINVSVRGYGGTNQVTGAGYAMICQVGNITIDNLKYSINPLDDWGAKTALTSVSTNISGLMINRTFDGTLFTNSTYWQLYTDPTNAPWGACNGTIELTAVAAS